MTNLNEQIKDHEWAKYEAIKKGRGRDVSRHQRMIDQLVQRQKETGQ